MDRLLKCITHDSRIRITVVDVTMTAKALEARHLSGPLASAVLAESLAAGALLASDASSSDEAWMLRMNVSGAVGGVLVESTGSGQLRGFTNQKTLGNLDAVLPIDTASALGDTGSVQIVSSMPGRILSQAVLNVTPPHLRFVLARYYNQSVQVPTGCCVKVAADDGGILSARALLVQRMDDSDQSVFIGALECLESEEMDAFLLERVWGDDIAVRVRDVLRCDPVAVREEKPLSFGCRCNKDRVLGILQSLSMEEVDGMIAAGKSQDVTCHMCGQTYTADTDDLLSVRTKMQETRS